MFEPSGSRIDPQLLQVVARGLEINPSSLALKGRLVCNI